MSELCNLCPRGCLVDRSAGMTGYCGKTNTLQVARAALHPWEEPCISGKTGSGTVFFTGCTLGCIFCQNRKITGREALPGKEITVGRLAEIFLELQQQGANNINLVTPTHYTVQIVESLKEARKQGLEIPVVYNTSGYERPETLRLLEGLVDIYLPDFKYMSPRLAKEYSFAEDYPKVAEKALQEMVRQTGKPVLDEATGCMKRGVIVRHLVLPGSTKDSMAVLKYLIETYGKQIYISIMNQYTPMEQVKNHPLLSRRVTKREYERVIDYAIKSGLEQGFVQEGETVGESFVPNFDGSGL